MDQQRDKIAEYRDHLKLKKMWEKYLETGDEGLANTLGQLMQEGAELPPECELERYPSSLVIMDDLGDDASVKLTGKSKLNNFICRIRHALFSYLGNYQSMTQASRTARKQCNLWLIFKTQDEKNLKSLYQECCSGDMKLPTFLAMFKELENKHDFIMIDMKAAPDKKYRINFDTYIVPTD